MYASDVRQAERSGEEILRIREGIRMERFNQSIRQAQDGSSPALDCVAAAMVIVVRACAWLILGLVWLGLRVGTGHTISLLGAA